MRDTGEIEPVSSLLRLAGEAERPDMSLVREDTRAEVSDWAEFCLVRPGVSSPAPLVEPLGCDLGERPRP